MREDVEDVDVPECGISEGTSVSTKLFTIDQAAATLSLCSASTNRADRAEIYFQCDQISSTITISNINDIPDDVGT